MGLLTKTVGNVMGLTQEARAQYHESKSDQNNPEHEASNEHIPSSAQPMDVDSTDECSWELDELQAQDNSSGDDESSSVDQLLGVFAQKHPKTENSPPIAQLPCPVVIPQRRPKHKDRGFVRAYAPVLDDCGIDQTTFMDFLKGFEKAIRMHPVFHAINLSVLGAAIAVDAISGPSITGHMIAFAMHASVEASRRGFIQYKTNKYLDGINEQLFKPHGLYAMVMTYKPENNKSQHSSKHSDSITDSINHRNDGHSHAFSSSSGTTRHEIDIPEVAPLIYPDIDAMEEAEKETAIKQGTHFLRDYFDRRAQAKFDHANPSSKLAVPRKDFASKYSDPNHPANTGNPIALITGGAHTGLLDLARGGKDSPLTKGGKSKKLGSVHKKILSQNVLYLMIVNLPSEKELEEAKQEMEKLGDEDLITDVDQ